MDFCLEYVFESGLLCSRDLIFSDFLYFVMCFRRNPYTKMCISTLGSFYLLGKYIANHESNLGLGGISHSTFSLYFDSSSLITSPLPPPGPTAAEAAWHQPLSSSSMQGNSQKYCKSYKNNVSTKNSCGSFAKVFASLVIWIGFEQI